MADRMKALAALGTLTEEAEARGDLRAVERLNLVLEAFTDALALASVTEQRRREDRDRKRKSADSSDSAEFPGIPGNSNRAFSRTSKATTTTTHTPRAREELDEATGALADVLGEEHWPAVDRFLSRRDHRTWPGWVREMRKALGPGSQYIPGDLSRVCDDDETLKREIGSAYALRTFLVKARIERTKPTEDVTNLPARRGSTVAQRTFDNGKKALEGL